MGVLLDAHWQILAPILGEPDLANHPSFATREERSRNRDICNMMLSDWFSKQNRAEAMETLRAHGLPVAPVQSFVEAARDPHVLERDMLQEVELPGGTTAPITGPAVKFSRTPTRIRRAAPELGEHTREILSEAGLSEAEQQRLRDAGLID